MMDVISKLGYKETVASMLCTPSLALPRSLLEEARCHFVSRSIALWHRTKDGLWPTANEEPRFSGQHPTRN